MSLQRYGVKVGRLWMRWPYFDHRDWWIGVYAPEPHYEMGKRHRVLYVCIVPTLVFLFDWTSRADTATGETP